MPQDQDSKRFIDFHGPWSGIVGDLPSVLLKNQDLVAASNCTFKDGFLSSRPILVTKYATPFGVNSGTLGYAPNIGPFAIVSGNFWQLNGGVWSQPIGATGLNNSPLFGNTYVTYRGTLYFGNSGGPTVNMFSYDGSTFTTINNQVTGAFYTTLADHLIVLNGGSGYSGASFSPRGVWWSGSGNPTVFNPATDLTAGFNQLNVDMVNGVVSNGRTANIFHPRGIIEMAPTGNGAQPFTFNDVVFASREGIGLWYGGSLADWGGIRCWMSKDDIYLWSAATGMIPISGRSYNSIFADVQANLLYSGALTTYLPAAAAGSGIHPISGSIVPFFSHGYVYPCYILNIPLSNTKASLWVYSLKLNVWENYIVNATLGEPGVIDGHFFTFNTNGNDERCYVLGRSAYTATQPNVYVMDGTNTNSPANFIQMKDEDTHGRFRTYDRLRILYNDKGAAQLTFTISGFNEDGTAVSSSSLLNGVPGAVTIGGISAGNDLQILIDMQSITCLVPTLSITSADGAGAFAIEQIEVLEAGYEAETENI